MDPYNLRIPVEGMSCASCVGRVERALRKVPGVQSADVNLASETAQVRVASPEAVEQAVAALAAAGYPARVEEATLDIEAMSCASCVGRVERTLSAVPGVVEARVNLATETAAVRYLEGQVTPAELAGAATAAGYPARPREAAVPRDAGDRREAEARRPCAPDAGRGAAGAAGLRAGDGGAPRSRRCTT